MARRKHHKKRSHRRKRHSIGAIGKGNIGSALGIIAGAVAGRLVANKLPFGDDKIKNAAVAAIGFVFPSVWKGETGKAVGNGMIAAGGLGLAAAFMPNTLGATDDVMEFPVSVGEVPDNISVIAGGESVMAGSDSVIYGDSLSVLAGYDEDEY
jgi:hypothetical protein